MRDIDLRPIQTWSELRIYLAASNEPWRLGKLHSRKVKVLGRVRLTDRFRKSYWISRYELPLALEIIVAADCWDNVPTWLHNRLMAAGSLSHATAMSHLRIPRCVKWWIKTKIKVVFLFHKIMKRSTISSPPLLSFKAPY